MKNFDGLAFGKRCDGEKLNRLKGDERKERRGNWSRRN
jgi:hypothetical protein